MRLRSAQAQACRCGLELGRSSSRSSSAICSSARCSSPSPHPFVRVPGRANWSTGIRPPVMRTGEQILADSHVRGRSAAVGYEVLAPGASHGRAASRTGDRKSRVEICCLDWAIFSRIVSLAPTFELSLLRQSKRRRADCRGISSLSGGHRKCRRHQSATLFMSVASAERCRNRQTTIQTYSGRPKRQSTSPRSERFKLSLSSDPALKAPDSEAYVVSGGVLNFPARSFSFGELIPRVSHESVPTGLGAPLCRETHLRPAQ